jgi:hypothetical protein
MANAGHLEIVDTIQGRSFLAIQSAMNVFQRHNPGLSKYQIEVVREGGSEVVLFRDQVRGGATAPEVGVRPGAAAPLSGRELQMLQPAENNLSPVDTIQDSSFLAIQSATDVFQRHNPDLSQYQIEVVRDGGSVVVIFTDKDRPPGAKGGSSQRPGFEVELRAEDLRVVRSNFLR